MKELLFAKLFKQYIKEYGIPDIVHLHFYMNGELAIWVKEKYNIPYVVTEYFSGFGKNTVTQKDINRAKNVFEKSSYNIAVSNEFLHLLERKVNNKFPRH